MQPTNATEYQTLQSTKNDLMKALGAVQDQLNKGGQTVIDIHHPENSPNWPRYVHQEYPKMLYHPAKLDQQIETQRHGIRLRNERNPNLAPLDLPASKPLTKIVANQDEEMQARDEGFVRTPPCIKADPEPESLDPLSNPKLLEKRRPGRPKRVAEAV